MPPAMLLFIALALVGALCVAVVWLVRENMRLRASLEDARAVKEFKRDGFARGTLSMVHWRALHEKMLVLHYMQDYRRRKAWQRCGSF